MKDDIPSFFPKRDEPTPQGVMACVGKRTNQRIPKLPLTGKPD